MEDIKVTIVCTTYNHEKHVRDALDSFLMQKTNFAFEILIHDDASTDSTQDIINEYYRKYPNIIRPIMQNENQYSKGVFIYKEFLWPNSRGKYIALCEGDDYWTDPYKLQYQYDALERERNIDCCTHKVKKIHADSNELMGYKAPYNYDKKISVKKVILGGGGYVATNSLFFRKEILEQKYLFTDKIMLDYVWQIHSSLRGGMLYLNKCMGVYRVGVSGSWSSSMQGEIDKRNLHTLKVIDMLQQLNVDTGGKYQRIIEKKIASCQLNIILRSGELQKMKNRPYYKYFVKAPIKDKIKFCIRIIKNCLETDSR